MKGWTPSAQQGLEEADELVGQVIDDLAVTELLGVGASGAAYRAVEMAADRRIVALKVLKRAEQELRVKLGFHGHPFARDLKVSQVVKSSQVARCYRIGETVDGRYYSVMELVDGESLDSELMYRQSLPWQEAVTLMIEVAKGVAAFHRHNVVLRDVSPANNIVKSQRNGDRRAKLIDFSTAMFGHESDKENTELFKTALGTPQYMAPEQALGQGSTRRSDVFSLGAVLYQMLAGRTVLSLKRATAHACMEYLRAGKTIPSIPLKELVSDTVPPGLVRVVDQCLAVDPVRRPPDADGFAAEIRRFLSKDETKKRSSASRIGDLVAGLLGRKKTVKSRFVRHD